MSPEFLGIGEFRVNMHLRRAAALCAVSILALAAAAQAATPVNPVKPLPTTALTLGTGGQMPAEEAAVTIEHVDLKVKVIPER